MFMEDRRPFTSGSQLGEGQPWARYVEELILQRFLDSGSSIMDRNLLLRITADNMGTDDLFAAELGALKGEVDVIIEAHLEANPDAPEGYDVSVRATRTEDAKVLSYRSSRSMDKEKARRDYFVAVQGGFQRETDVEYLTLDEMTLSVVDRIMMDLTERFWAK